MNSNMKVVWICQVSNEQLRKHLLFRVPIWLKIIRWLMNRDTSDKVGDYAIWNVNAIKEFQDIESVDLHVIFVHEKMQNEIQRFKEGRINFYAVSIGDKSFLQYVKTHVFKKQFANKTWRRIALLIKEIGPDLIHLMGAENPSYSLSIISIPDNIPIVVQLQTLLHAPESNGFYLSQKECEYQVLQRADYIGTDIEWYKKVIKDTIKPSAKFVNTGLMVAEDSKNEESSKQYDFVYFANYISKSIDLAIESFGIAHSRHPELTLDIIGGAYEDDMLFLKQRIKELNCIDAVTIEGRLSTHEDVINQIRRSRFALLPLKTDFISGSIRESMWNGLPVITTITTGTPILNKTRESVLLSEIGDHVALADNICKLVESPALAELLQKNALITVEEIFGGNRNKAAAWVNTYKECIEKYKYEKK